MSAYPYEEKLGTCRFNKANAIAKTRGYVSIKGSSEEALKNAVATVGPVAVAIHALNNLGSYRSGVYYDPTCTGGRNHAVLVVGYGTENGMDYWLVKNSWGAGFGQDGFIKMARNKNNMCDIAGDPMYPIF